MLKLRILTALVLAPAIVFATLALPHSGFAFVAALIFAVGAWEWAGLSRLTLSSRAGYAGLLAALFVLGYSFMGIWPAYVKPVLATGLVWWGVALVLVMRFPRGNALWNRSSLACGAAGALVLLPAWIGLVALHAVDPYLALLAMLLVSFADIGAYFAGRSLGRHKLAPRVSPGKTWEGLGGALVVALGVGLIAAQLIPIRSEASLYFVALCLMTVLVSILGDLVESMFKRMAGAKDSGGLLPGHGGVLDRIDSLTAAAPVFALGISALKVVA